MHFPRTIGHEKQKQLFLTLKDSGRLNHAYALVGPDHIGKTTFALDCAALLKADPVLDVVVYDDPEGLSIENARDLQNRLSLTPALEQKVAVVAGAEKMTTAAANSLLKTLEEPPARSFIFLTTPNFYALLPTVASRLTRMNFSNSEPHEVEAGLRELNIEGENLARIAALARGKIGLARLLASDAKLLEFITAAKQSYQTLLDGSLVERFQASEKIATFPTEEISDFLKFAMREWVDTQGSRGLAEKLQAAWNDLKFNPNSRLLLDNLFLT